MLASEAREGDTFVYLFCCVCIVSLNRNGVVNGDRTGDMPGCSRVHSARLYVCTGPGMCRRSIQRRVLWRRRGHKRRARGSFRLKQQGRPHSILQLPTLSFKVIKPSSILFRFGKRMLCSNITKFLLHGSCTQRILCWLCRKWHVCCISYLTTSSWQVYHPRVYLLYVLTLKKKPKASDRIVKTRPQLLTDLQNTSALE